MVNTDAESYGGSGVGNLGTVRAEDVAWHGRPASAALRVPPLGVLWLRARFLTRAMQILVRVGGLARPGKRRRP